MTSLLLGQTVHYVRRTELGPRCVAALVTAVANPMEEYREHDTVGLVAETGLETIRVSLLLGGCRYDTGTPRDELVEYPPDTWHHRAECRGLH